MISTNEKIQIILIGESSVGKTSIIYRYDYKLDILQAILQYIILPL